MTEFERLNRLERIKIAEMDLELRYNYESAP